MRDETTQAAEQLTAYSHAYWKLCTIVLGIALMISLVIHAGGPAGAVASEAGGERSGTPEHRHSGGGTLSIGGFEALDGQPYFVIMDDQGRKLGMLPMSFTSERSD